MRCHRLVCMAPYPSATSPTGSEASSGAVTPEILLEKISRLRRSGEEYSAALEQFIDTLGKRGLERGDVQSRSRLALGQFLIDRRQEEAETIQQAKAHVERPGRLEDVEDDHVSGDQEE